MPDDLFTVMRDSLSQHEVRRCVRALVYARILSAWAVSMAATAAAVAAVQAIV